MNDLTEAHPSSLKAHSARIRNYDLSERQQLLLDYAREHSEVLVEPMAESLAVTPQTIRRDLNIMCGMRLLQRVHGGAVLSDGVSNMGYEARKRLRADEKGRIGRAAAALIPNDSSLFVNIGTTTEAVVERLAERNGLLVVTNNLNVVETLRKNESISIMIAGGRVRSEDGGIVGEASVSFINQFKMNNAVIGVSAIDPDGALLDFDHEEVRVAKAIIANARTVTLVADSSKFDRNAPMRIGHISDVDHIVTDKPPSEAFADLCARHNTQLIVA